MQCAAKRNECTHLLVVYSGIEVVLNRPGYVCAITYTVAQAVSETLASVASYHDSCCSAWANEQLLYLKTHSWYL